MVNNKEQQQLLKYAEWQKVDDRYVVYRVVDDDYVVYQRALDSDEKDFSFNFFCHWLADTRNI